MLPVQDYYNALYVTERVSTQQLTAWAELFDSYSLNTPRPNPQPLKIQNFVVKLSKVTRCKHNMIPRHCAFLL